MRVGKEGTGEEGEDILLYWKQSSMSIFSFLTIRKIILALLGKNCGDNREKEGKKSGCPQAFYPGITSMSVVFVLTWGHREKNGGYTQ